MKRVRARLVFSALALALAAGCADGSPHVRVGTASDFSPTPGARVSVLGVFRDGRMSEDSWKPLATPVSRALGSGACSAGWGEGMREAQPELAKWVEDTAREDGVTEDLLARVAPSAKGDLMMTLMVYRYMPKSRTRPAAGQPRVQTGPPRRRGYGRIGPRPVEQEEEHVFELSASLYSVRAHKLVAEIDLRYGGDDLDEAMNAFVGKLKTVVPGASCVGWAWPDRAPTDDD